MEDTPIIDAEKPPLDLVAGVAVRTHRMLAELTLSVFSAHCLSAKHR